MKWHMNVYARSFLIMILILCALVSYPVQGNNQSIVTIHGKVTYEPRNLAVPLIYSVAREVEIDLYEKSYDGIITKLNSQPVYTNSNGDFSFSATNYWGPHDPYLNVFYKVNLSYQSTAVYDPLDNNKLYQFDSSTTFLNSDTTIDWTKDFIIDHSFTKYKAMWIFEDIRKAWNFVNTNDIRNGIHYDPGGVVAYWSMGSSCYQFICNSYSTPNYIFIADTNMGSMDVVVHETGHKFMANGGWWYPYPDCWSHYIFGVSDQQCAWSEGWADFFAMAVNDDPCYNFRLNPCSGIADMDYYNLEIHSRADDPSQFPWGDGVEGRVAAVLYDLYDYPNEGFDMVFAGFAPISQLALGNPGIHPLSQFWYAWNLNNGQSHLKSGLTFWWNTIDYANIRRTLLPVVTK